MCSNFAPLTVPPHPTAYAMYSVIKGKIILWCWFIPTVFELGVFCSAGLWGWVCYNEWKRERKGNFPHYEDFGGNCSAMQNNSKWIKISGYLCMGLHYK